MAGAFKEKQEEQESRLAQMIPRPVEAAAKTAQGEAEKNAYRVMQIAFNDLTEAMEKNGRPLPKDSIIRQMVG